MDIYEFYMMVVILFSYSMYPFFIMLFHYILNIQKKTDELFIVEICFFSSLRKNSSVYSISLLLLAIYKFNFSLYFFRGNNGPSSSSSSSG